ncbi:hypothetical protein H7R52_02100 [Weissella confusa]|uniref:Uncharacterized protein n=1 Tax=Weissella confusa TaxID=1583 RepID=A0A923SNV1_WEICO|nr:hypothetical protein [Weissella confusa]
MEARTEVFSFGPAIDKLEEILGSLEDDFAEFARLTEAGDHATAAGIYETLGMETNQLEQRIEQIPGLFKSLDESQGLNFVKTAQELKQLQQLIRDAEMTIDVVNQGLSDLEKLDEAHKAAVKELEVKYQDLRKTLLSQNRKVAKLLQKKEQLAEIPMRDRLVKGRQLSLTGQSLKQFQLLENKYGTLETQGFNEIENQANSVLFDSKKAVVKPMA